MPGRTWFVFDSRQLHMTVYFTSDLHLGHRAMAWMREHGEWPKSVNDKAAVPPELVAAHDQLLADRWDATVTEHDVVWVLGDLVANNKSVPMALQWIKDRPGKKHFILGNHDPAHPMHQESHKWVPIYQEAFESVQMAATRDIVLRPGRKQKVLLSHFPYEGDSKAEARANQWRLRDEGLPLLHGHVHSTDKLTVSSHQAPARWEGQDALYAPAKQIHVGVDAWDFKPVSLDQVVELLDV